MPSATGSAKVWVPAMLSLGCEEAHGRGVSSRHKWEAFQLIALRAITAPIARGRAWVGMARDGRDRPTSRATTRRLPHLPCPARFDAGVPIGRQNQHPRVRCPGPAGAPHHRTYPKQPDLDLRDASRIGDGRGGIGTSTGFRLLRRSGTVSAYRFCPDTIAGTTHSFMLPLSQTRRTCALCARSPAGWPPPRSWRVPYSGASGCRHQPARPSPFPLPTVGSEALTPRSIARVLQFRAAQVGFASKDFAEYILKRGALTTGMHGSPIPPSSSAWDGTTALASSGSDLITRTCSTRTRW